MTTDKTNDVLAAALRYASERNWHVFPADLSGPNKKSFKSAEHGGGKRWGATRDPVQIARDFTNPRFPNPGIGLPCGIDNEIWVLDVDTMEGHDDDGEASLRRLIEANGPLPLTPTARTPSKGWHYLFRRPRDGGPEIRNSHGTTDRDGVQHGIADGIDVRGEGGMAVLPPTRTKKGQYSWVNSDAPIADAPEWLIALARAASASNGGNRTPSAEPEADLEKLAAAVAVIPNPDLDYESWNRFGMAIWRASAGRGFAMFDSLSQRSKKYDAQYTANTWAGYFKWPPTKVGAGTIFFKANEAAPGWQDAYYAEGERRTEEAKSQRRLYVGGDRGVVCGGDKGRQHGHRRRSFGKSAGFAHHRHHHRRCPIEHRRRRCTLHGSEPRLRRRERRRQEHGRRSH